MLYPKIIYKNYASFIFKTLDKKIYSKKYLVDPDIFI